MKWHGGDFESEADYRHDDGRRQQRIESLAFERRGDRPEFDRTRQTVKETQSKQRERRRHATEEEILQSRFR